MYCIMQQGNNTDEAEASIPTENERNGGRKMSLRHKFSNLLCHFGPFFSNAATATGAPRRQRRRSPSSEK
jgi:hypothetical protein